MRCAALVTLGLVACSSPEAPGLELRGALPDYGPLAGGTVIVLDGEGLRDATRVWIGGREAPFLRALDDTTLEVVIPPGARPGDAEVVVFGRSSTTTAQGLFRYSAPPTLTGVSPADVLFSSTTTELTITGTGFLDDGAGRVHVLIDGALQPSVRVISDSQLVITAPPGVPLVRPDIEVIDDRGTATLTRAYRYRPSLRSGLLLFPAAGDALANFYDPVDHSLTTIPIVTPLPWRLTAVVPGPGGDFWGLDRARRFGRIDTKTTTLEAPRQLANLLPTITRAGDAYYAIDRIAQRIGRFDPDTGVFTPIGTNQIPCCGSFGLASDGTTLYFTSRRFLPAGGTQVTINTFDPTSGGLGTPVVVQGPTLHVEEMRFFNGTLYASSRDSTLVTIDPATGTVQAVSIPPATYKAMEVFE
ncbi:MAG: IPT/TIG domain-containing protein [Kofleriaceae bacterium]|nr:IPT/TIG domain-containing protein [Kofleriaceae bacterium]